MLSYSNFYPESLTSVFEFGRSPDFFNANLPSQHIVSGFEVIASSNEVLKQVQHKLTVAGTVQE